MPAPDSAEHDLRTAVAALRLLVDGWRDGVVDARPGTVDGELLRARVRALGALVAELTVTRRPPAP